MLTSRVMGGSVMLTAYAYTRAALVVVVLRSVVTAMATAYLRPRINTSSYASG